MAVGQNCYQDNGRIIKIYLGEKDWLTNLMLRLMNFSSLQLIKITYIRTKKILGFLVLSGKIHDFFTQMMSFGIYITVVLNNIIGIGLVMAKNCSQLVRSNMMFSIALSNKWYIGVTMGRLLGMKGWYMFVFVFMFSHVIHLIVKMK